MFEKQIGREDKIDIDDDEIFVRDFDEDPIPRDPAAPKIIAHNFGLGPERFNLEKEKLNDDLDLGQDENFLDPQPIERKVKGYVYMDRGEERFREKLNPDPLYDDLPLNELDNDIYGALEKGTKPQVSVPDFNRFANGDKSKKIDDLINEYEGKAKKDNENVGRSKNSYSVKNVFPGNAKKKKAAKKKRPKQAFESAQDEVERYLKELGFE